MPDIKNKELIERLKKFQKTLNIKLNHCNLNYFYKNIKKLVIKRTLFSKNSGYDIKLNILRLSYYEDFEHELFHMASSYCKDNYYSGFSVNLFGNGLNEGYTQVLCNRYFKKDILSYPFETSIALNIEKIIGRKKMEKLYFEVNQDLFINELSGYINQDIVIYVIKLIDILSNNVSYKKEVNHSLIEILKEININLLEIYINKLIIDFKNKTITEKQLYIKIKRFAKGLKFVIDPQNKKISILDEETINSKVKLFTKV